MMKISSICSSYLIRPYIASKTSHMIIYGSLTHRQMDFKTFVRRASIMKINTVSPEIGAKAETTDDVTKEVGGGDEEMPPVDFDTFVRRASLASMTKPAEKGNEGMQSLETLEDIGENVAEPSDTSSESSSSSSSEDEDDYSSDESSEDEPRLDENLQRFENYMKRVSANNAKAAEVNETLKQLESSAEILLKKASSPKLVPLGGELPYSERGRRRSYFDIVSASLPAADPAS